jgi:hypothetical protein
MSGGHYNYAYGRIEDLAADIARDANTPLRRAFVSHLMKVAQAAKAIEWNESGDGDSREDELIRACISPTAELEQATEDAHKAIAELERLLGKDDA